ncbi:hypothetical protein SEHO0A_03205 [Salmonella enterica subsp. houtenae str. ATCC BAA-1581]|nr:hypothetical protein SEHO0A_03205 [Salmonella enterica subsp. houtenae str. ATCC BAA-1581]ENZ85469.1 hypothetical protein D088_700059 [Salmonella enterica subsp. houtenae serovar 16:z4,z32:-- str. RKS3027]
MKGLFYDFLKQRRLTETLFLTTAPDECYFEMVVISLRQKG